MDRGADGLRSITHDMRNLLTAVRGHAELALRGISPAQAAREDVAHVVVVTAALFDLVDQIDGNDSSETLVASSLDPTVLGMRRLLDALLPAGVDMELATDAAGAFVRIPKLRIERVVLNLALNARDAMVDGGKLRISTERVSDKAVEIVVADTGPGFSDEALEHLFEEGFTTKADRGGSGHGLAALHGIAGAAGGSITVESEADKGATVRVRLPLVAMGSDPVDASAVDGAEAAEAGAPASDALDGEAEAADAAASGASATEAKAADATEAEAASPPEEDAADAPEAEAERTDAPEDEDEPTHAPETEAEPTDAPETEAHPSEASETAGTETTDKPGATDDAAGDGTPAAEPGATDAATAAASTEASEPAAVPPWPEADLAQDRTSTTEDDMTDEQPPSPDEPRPDERAPSEESPPPIEAPQPGDAPDDGESPGPVSAPGSEEAPTPQQAPPAAEGAAASASRKRRKKKR